MIKEKLLKIFKDVKVEYYEKTDVYKLKLPIYHYKPMSPEFIFYIEQKGENYIVDDNGMTIRSLINNDALSDEFYEEIKHLAKVFRLEILNNGRLISEECENLEALPYFVSYMIQFIAIVNYKAYGNELMHKELFE